MERTITDVLQKNITSLKGIYLFGSRANDSIHPDSDWDVAFLLDDLPLPALQKWKLQENLASELHTDVDLIDLQDASTVLRFQIITTGKRIFCADEYFCDSFELVAYSMYQHLQEERKEIIATALKCGSIYG